MKTLIQITINKQKKTFNSFKTLPIEIDYIKLFENNLNNLFVELTTTFNLGSSQAKSIILKIKYLQK